MTTRILKKFEGKILIIGPIYDKISILPQIEKISSNYNLIILNGNICYPFDDLIFVKQRIDLVSQLNKVMYNLGDHDLQLLKILRNQNNHFDIQNWINQQPNMIIIEFKNQSNFIITNGGMIESITYDKLINNLETTFISQIDNKSWHQLYFGQHGYIISNNPLSLQEPQFYPYSMQMGNKYSENNKIYGQELDAYGLKQTILFENANKNI